MSQRDFRYTGAAAVNFTTSTQITLAVERLKRPRAGKADRAAFFADPEGWTRQFIETRPRHLRHRHEAPAMAARIRERLEELGIAADELRTYEVTVDSPFEGHGIVASFRLRSRSARTAADEVAADYPDSGSVLAVGVADPKDRAHVARRLLR